MLALLERCSRLKNQPFFSNGIYLLMTIVCFAREISTIDSLTLRQKVACRRTVFVDGSLRSRNTWHKQSSFYRKSNLSENVTDAKKDENFEWNQRSERTTQSIYVEFSTQFNQKWLKVEKHLKIPVEVDPSNKIYHVLNKTFLLNNYQEKKTTNFMTKQLLTHFLALFKHLLLLFTCESWASSEPSKRNKNKVPSCRKLRRKQKN